jgi:hypothetical protein
MRKFIRFGIATLLAVCVVTGVKSQVIFSEDFDNVGGPIAGGPGTYYFPSGWLMRNVDNLTPYATVSYINEAWERREDFKFNTADSCAFSTSWYSPAGVANDFMWTPAIGPLPALSILTWNAVAYDPSYPDGYEVRIMTVAPTGGTGTIGNQITNSVVLFSTAAESSSWTNHNVDLNAYAGQTVYIGFRNNSNDQFILAIDDIIVKVNKNYDAMLTSLYSPSCYTMIPQQQAAPLNLRAHIKNNGEKSLHNLALKCQVLDHTGAQVYTTTGTTLDSLVKADTASLLAGTFLPATADSFTFVYSVLSTETDQDTTNNKLSNNIIISDTIYAMEKTPYTGSLGIGAGVTGYMGNQFTINDTTELRSVSLSFNRGYVASGIYAVVWNMAAGVPSAIIASTDTIPYSGIAAQTLTIPVSGGPFTLLPGEYVVTAVETDSLLALGTSTTYFVSSKSWVYWSTIPSGLWVNPESISTTFKVSFAVRANLYHCPNMTSDIIVTDATCSSCADGMASATTTNGTAPYTYNWSNGATVADISNLLPGTYILTISDAFRCNISDTASIGITVGIETYHNDLGVSPNPGSGIYQMNLPSAAGLNASVSVYTQDGRMLYSEDIPAGTQGAWKLEISKLSPAVYVVVYSDGQKISAQKVIKQ